VTPEQHYKEAERLLVDVGDTAEEVSAQLKNLEDPSVAAGLAGLMVLLGLAEAQVHATLANCGHGDWARFQPREQTGAS
jgi:hypothetical protein